jgi:arylsulfatase A-like enzyme
MLNAPLRTIRDIAIPGMVMGIVVAGMFSLISVVDGIGDLRLILYYLLSFLIIFLLMSFFFVIYGKLIKTKLSAHHQFYLLNIFLLGVMVLFMSSYALKLIQGSLRQQPFYSFPRVLTFLLPIFVFLGLSRVSRRSWKNLFTAITIVLMLSWTIGALLGKIDLGTTHSDKSQESPNILLLTIESLRYDHLGFTSRNKIKTEVLDSLINKGVFFANYFVQAPYTTASLSTLVTGRYPFNHGSRYFGQKPKSGLQPYFEKLVEDGYTSRIDVSFYPELFSFKERFASAFSERIFSINYYLSAWLGNVLPEWFGAYTFSTSTSLIETSRLIRAIRINRKKKWFFWTHFTSNCHWPYESPPQFVRMYTRPQKHSKIAFSKKDVFDLNANPERISRDVIEQLDVAYSAEVSCIDKQIGFIMHQLESLNLLEHTVVIISADHGECLGEDGFVGHGRSLKDNLIHVPLIIYSKNSDYCPRHEEINQFIEEVDLAPTILDIAGVKYDRGIFDGTSVLDFLEHDKWEKKFVYSEFVLDEVKRFYASLRTEQFKLIWDSGKNRFSLYELSRDPFETSDVSQDYPVIVEEMKRAMLKRAGKSEYAELKPEIAVHINEDMKERMRALGYIK